MYALSVTKQLAFLLNAFKITHPEYSLKTSKADLKIYERSTSRVEPISLPHGMSKTFGVMKINESKLTIPDDSKKLQSLLAIGATKPATTNEEYIEGFKSSLSPIKEYFSHQEHPDFPAISAAIEWYQDSIESDNQTFSYLAACIGLEALIGTEDHMDAMSKRLTDRYAALMGKGRTDRNALAMKYQTVLRLRGEIVHAKSARLTAKHSSSLSDVQKMLWDVIWHEIKQMYKGNEKI